MRKREINIAIFASGSGTNAENVIRFFNFERANRGVRVKLIVTNRVEAGVIERGEKLNIESYLFSSQELTQSHSVDNLLESEEIDFILLAGFLLKLPERIVERYRGRVVNLHPSLLPKYGGKGMYGERVHRAVIEGGEKLSGITIHLVDEEYDRGEILFQAQCVVESDETPSTLAAKIHKLEYQYLPKVLLEYIMEL